MFIATPAKVYRLAHAGNSLVAGTYLPSVNDRYSNRLQAMLDATGRWSNINSGYPGLPTFNPVTPDYSLIGRYTWDTYPGGAGVYEAPPVVSLAMTWEITNEIRGIPGTTTQTALAHWAQWIALLRATGWKTITFTVLPTTLLNATSAQLQMIAQCTDVLRVNPSKLYGDDILDPAAWFPDPTDLTFYMPDQLHLNSHAHSVMSLRLYNYLMATHQV